MITKSFYLLHVSIVFQDGKFSLDDPQNDFNVLVGRLIIVLVEGEVSRDSLSEKLALDGSRHQSIPAAAYLPAYPTERPYVRREVGFFVL